MKKTIFDLSYEEGKKVDAELRKTSYFKQYATGFMISIVLLVFLSCIELFVLALFENTISDTLYQALPAVSIVIMIGFAILFLLLFFFKRFDLVKQFYEEKYNK